MSLNEVTYQNTYDVEASDGSRTIIKKRQHWMPWCPKANAPASKNLRWWQSSWREMISPCWGVPFTDSEAVLGSFLTSWSANEGSDRLMDVILSIEAEFNQPSWIERVLNQGNPADVLSREVVIVLGSAKRVEVDPWEMWCLYWLM